MPHFTSQSRLRMVVTFIVVLLYSTFIAANEPPAKQLSDSFEKVKNQYRDDLLKSMPDESIITKLIEQQTPDGRWPEIDYADQNRGNWDTAKHVSYLETMAKAFCSPTSKLQNDPALKQAILRGIDHWLEKRYVCPNWWFNQIGCPKSLVNTIFLIKSDLSATQLSGSLDYIKQAKFGMTGQNSVWTAGITFVRALIEEDQSLAVQARDIILKDLKITTAEGLQPDNSFHQHGPQQQFGNYGLSFASDMTRWGLLWQGTDFALSDHQIELLRGYLLDGLHLTLYQGRMDISSCGRQLHPNAPRQKAAGVIGISHQMQQLDPSNADQYGNVNKIPPQRSKHFWRSDYFVQHTDHYMTTVKMSSNRVQGTETCNDENMQGYFLGDGAHYVYAEGDEYDDIFPVWDWRHLPGVTCHQNPEQSLRPKNARTNESDFVGGLGSKTIVSGKQKSYQPGVATLDYNRDGVRAKKSWFFFDGSIACLGAGIQSEKSYPVHTTVNQCYLDGPVYVWIDDVQTEHPAGQLAVYKNVDAIWHNNILYQFPEPTEVNVSTRTQTGSWKLVRSFMPDTPVSHPIFLIWLDHGIQPQNVSYCYIMTPNYKPELLKTTPAPQGVTILSNSTDLQEAISTDGTQLAATIYQPADLKIKTSSGENLTVDQPCILSIGESQATITDPTQKQKQIDITVGKNTKTISLSPSGTTFF